MNYSLRILSIITLFSTFVFSELPKGEAERLAEQAYNNAQEETLLEEVRIKEAADEAAKRDYLNAKKAAGFGLAPITNDHTANHTRCDDTEVTFTLDDYYSDGFEATLSFDGTDMTGNTGDTFAFCLVDGDYTYTYACSNYCSEHSWTVTLADGTALSSGSGSNGSSQTLSFTVDSSGVP